jgi:AcrR family transcriptional regulator
MAKKRIESIDPCGEGKSGPGRPRCLETRAAVLKAAQELLERGGAGALSIEAVAKRAGVAKTTIYRRWATRGALAIDVFLQIAEKRSPFPEAESAMEGFKQQMQALARLLRGNVGRTAAAILAEAQSDEDTRKAFIEHYLLPRRAAGQKLLERGVANGEIRDDIDPALLADMLYGPLYLRLMLRHAPLNDEAVEKLIDLVFNGIRPLTTASNSI